MSHPLLKHIITRRLLVKGLEKGANAIGDSRSYNKGYDHYFSNEYEKAIEEFTNAISHNPKNVKAYHLRGMSYLSLENIQKGKIDLEKAALLYKEQGDMILYKTLDDTVQDLVKLD